MRRSGTSLAANLVSAAGAYLDDSTPADYRNPRGYFESREVTDLNRRILAAIGAPIFWIPKLDPGWPEASRFDRYRARARRLISDLDSHPVWALKDPRFSITLPFWLPLFNRRLRFVVCIRNPLEMVMSEKPARAITHRDFLAWYAYTMHALRNTTGGSRLIVHFHRFFETQAFSQATLLMEFIGLQAQTDVRSAVVPGLYRNKVSLQALLDDKRVPSSVKSLYLQLLSHEELGGGIHDATGCSAAGSQNRTQSMPALFFRLYGLAWAISQRMRLLERLSESSRKRLAETFGMWDF